jgi:hypothetical protein
MSRKYENGHITVDGEELHYQFERAVILGPGQAKETIPGEGGLVLRGNINTLIEIFKKLETKPEVKFVSCEPSTVKVFVDDDEVTEASFDEYDALMAPVAEKLGFSFTHEMEDE